MDNIKVINLSDLQYCIRYGFPFEDGISKTFPGRLENITAEEVFNQMSKRKCLKDNMDLDDEWKPYFRTMRLMPRLARNVTIESGTTLLSLIGGVFCKRDKRIHQSVEEDVIRDEMSDSPLNIDYNDSFLGKKYRDLLGERTECVVSVKHMTRAEAPYVLCNQCKGTGFVKCPACGGTGREQYSDGYYASGEERIRTTACSECHGRGRIECPECFGKGEVEIFSKEYSVIKSVEEQLFQEVYGKWSAPWGSDWWDTIYYNPDEQEEEENKSYMTSMDKAYAERYSYREAEKAELLNKAGNVVMMKKNRHELAIERSGEILEELASLGLEKEYQVNLSGYSRFIADEKYPEICRQELHYIFPAVKIQFTLKGERMKAYLFQEKEDTILCIMTEASAQTSAFVYFIYRMAAFVRWIFKQFK